MEFQIWHIASTWRARELRWGVERLDSLWISRGTVTVEGAGVGGKGRNGIAESRIASHGVRETATIAVACSKDLSCVDTVGRRQISN